jgi:glycerol-3-phosphate dehydrogenase (NAD(P)+)
VLTNKKIALLGGGAFGVALAKISALQFSEIVLWARDFFVCEHINSYHRHPQKLAHIELPKNIVATNNLSTALKNAHVVILTLPMGALESVLTQACHLFEPTANIISTAKGIAMSSAGLKLPCDIIQETLPHKIAQRACYLSGPSFALELAENLPTALTLACASAHRATALQVQREFSQKNLRLYYSEDVIGVCVGGALKNVIAIAAGACMGLGLGRNALASLITRGLVEMSRLAKSMGGEPETLRGLSGMGDLVLSCTDTMSRNFRLGNLLAKKLTLQQGLDQIGSVVEGAQTAKAVEALTQKYHIEMPISSAVYQVLYENTPLEKAMTALLTRDLKDEQI